MLETNKSRWEAGTLERGQLHYQTLIWQPAKSAKVQRSIVPLAGRRLSVLRTASNYRLALSRVMQSDSIAGKNGRTV